MEFDGFDWDDGNRDKCRKHGVSIGEIEALFAGELRIGPDPYPGMHERRFRAVGTTKEGETFLWSLPGDHGKTKFLSVRSVPDTCTRRKPRLMKIRFPEFKSDEEAEKFVETADLSKYDFSDMVPMRFELRRKDKSVSLRLPESLLEEVRIRAAQAGMPYQRFMRLAIERALQKP